MPKRILPKTVSGVTREDMMTRIHARDPEGRWLKGLDAFEAVYGAAGLAKTARS
jgi:hypothetical protein